jgi:hypothetical protein
MKRLITVEATFPELKGGKIHQTARCECGGITAGVAKCLRDLLKRDGVKRKRLSTMKLEVTWVKIDRLNGEVTS